MYKQSVAVMFEPEPDVHEEAELASMCFGRRAFSGLCGVVLSGLTKPLIQRCLTFYTKDKCAAADVVGSKLKMSNAPTV